MSSLATQWTSFRSQFPEHRAQLGLSLRVTIAALSGFAFSHVLKVPLPLWTVVTAVVLTQATFGRSMKATVDYLVGTLGGAVYAGVVAVLVPHSNDVSLAGVLALAVAPLAFLGAVYPSFSVAPLTGVLVLLVPRFVHVGPIESAVDRVLEVSVGAIIALAVSLLVLPARAHSFVIEGAARTLDLMAGSLPELFEGFIR
ncbi:MAG: FUSC family protein, partial [Roseiarcus sp.]